MKETLERLLERLKELQAVHGNDSICKYTSFQLCIEEIKKEIENNKTYGKETEPKEES